LENSKRPEKITYKHPLLQPILEVTYGCIVYQEQVIEIFRRLGGFSLGQADMIRRAMSKKKQSEIEREKRTFIDGDPERSIAGAVNNGVPRDVASAVYDEILDFANYAFNKAHAVAYAVISYQTAYLKRHYPRQYMAALLSSVLDYPEKVSEYAAEALELGIKLLPPDVNESGDMFTVAGNDIRYGLVAVKNIGRGFILGLIAERTQNGRFTDFEQFVRRMGTRDLNRRALESLIKCGGFDSFGVRRSQLMAVCENVLAAAGSEARRNVTGQLDLFGAGAETAHAKIIYPNVPDYTAAEKMEMEHEVTGLYLSGHPMDEYREIARRRGASKISEILDDYAREDGNVKFSDGQTITLAGVVSHIRSRTTKNNTLMSYVTLDDGTGTLELLAFQRTIDEYGSYMRENAAVLAIGKLSARDEKAPQVMLDRLTPITDSRDETQSADSPAAKQSQKLYLRVKNEDDPKYEHVRLVLSMFPGKTPLVLYFEDTKKKLGSNCLIRDDLLDELRETLGEDNVVVKADSN
jgi:DNA polymerase-3 subunit alpha